MCNYAVVDLEMCKVPRGARKGSFRRAYETIQIGAVLLNGNLEIVDEFVTYVSPEYGCIDTYIRNLTGITQNNIIGAPDMKSALQAFMDWLPQDTRVVSWSNNDACQIRQEMEAKNISTAGMEDILDNWIDCQKTFSEKMKSEKCYKLSEALIATDICYKDGAHDGLVDAYNTALLFAKMERETELVLNPYYQSAISEEESGCGFLLGSLFSQLDLSALVTA